MFTQLSTTAESISKASTMVLRIGTDAHLYDDPDDANIVSLLDSKYDVEICEALKRLLALIAQGFDVSNFFPQVVKNVASHSIEVKKLVYLYLLHYAEKRPNEALLSINYFQKDLGDPNPLVRAWALRTMAGIRLHVIAQLVLVAVKKCARDPSVYVRKCAANALPKLQDLRLDEHAAAIEEVVEILLNDHSPGVIGAAAAAFASVCPNNLSLIGKYYKRLCETLPDVEEWGQIILIGILLRYAIARHGLVKESIMFSSSQENGDSRKEGSDACSEVKEDFNNYSNGTYHSEVANIIFRSYLEGPDKYLSRLQYSDKSSALDDSYFTSARSNDDIRLLVQCTSPLLWSQNSAVVLAAAGVHWIMAPKEDFRRVVKPLLFLLRSSIASKYVVLCNIQVFAKALPSLFSQHFEDFFISSLDPYQIKMLKLDILSLIATESSISSILQEFQDYVRDPDRKFAADTVSAIGLCAQRLPTISKTCLEGLLALTSPESLNSDAASVDEEAVVLIQAINSIKEIIQQHPASHEKVIAHLIRSLDSIRVPAARAMVIWMVGEYNFVGEIVPKILPTVLQYLAWSFKTEALEAKLQILNACVKVLLHSGENSSTFQSILSYVLDVAKCDLNYDVRDRARLLNHLMSSYISSDNAKEVKCQEEVDSVSEKLVRHLLGGQFKPSSSQSLTYRYYLPGSLSQLVLHAAPGYEPLPEPRSLVFEEINSNIIQGTRRPEDEGTQSDSYEEDESVSGSLNGESTTGYSSQDSETTLTQGGDYGRGSNSEVDDNADPLIHFSDIGNQTNYGEVSKEASGTNDFGVLMSKKALESWLDESSSVDQNSADMSYIKRSSARISIGDLRGRVQLKSHALLNPANGNGLSVEYIFTPEVSNISKLLVCLEATFKNYSSEPVSNILLVEEDESSRSPESSDQAFVSSSTSWTSSTDVPALVPMEEILELGPGHIIKRMLQVRFHHHLLPLKLVLLCNGKKHPVKLRPDIGYFVKPLPMDADMFAHKESQLPGMFEYSRRCIISDHVEGLLNNKDNKDNFLVICESLALKILSNTNVHLVSVDLPVASNLDDVSGLRLRFSGEVISKGLPCLITITLDGRCSEPLNASVKVNCEETVFGLNLLNRVVKFLAEYATQQV